MVAVAIKHIRDVMLMSVLQAA